MKAFPNVWVIILNWNGKSLTVDCLESLKAVRYQNYHVLLVDNGSVDGSVPYLRQRYPDLDMVEIGKNLGFAEGNNVGMRIALEKGADYVLLLNNDTIADPSFISDLVEAAEADPGIGFAGPKVYFYDFKGRKDVISFAGGLLDMRKGKSIHIGEKQVDSGQHDRPRDVDYVEGSCMLVRADVIKKIGMLDPAYFAYWEEMDWCVRGARAGYRLIYVPGSKIWHKIGASSVGSSNVYLLTRNRFWFMRKYASRQQFLLFMLYFFGYWFWEMSRHYLFHRNLQGLKAFYKGIGEGLRTWPW